MEIYSREPHRPRVPKDISESNAAGPALGGVHPITAPGIRYRVPIAAVPDVEPIQSVEGDGQPDAEQFQEENQRKIGQKAHLPRVSLRPADRRGVGNQNMFEEECADRDDARQGVKAPQEKRGTLTRPQGSHSMRYSLRGTFRNPGSSRTG